MVDLWRWQQYYDDVANAPDQEHAQYFLQAAKSVQPHWAVTHMLQLPSTDAARLFNDESVDFVYVDARHDYCGVLDDIKTWWPKVRAGGIMAGNDWGQQQALHEWQ